MGADVMRTWVAGQCVLPDVMVRGVKAMNVDLNEVARGDAVVLRAEPTNLHDSHAIQVLGENEQPLGYLPRNYAEAIKADAWQATVSAVLEFEGRPAGLRLRLVRKS